MTSIVPRTAYAAIALGALVWCSCESPLSDVPISEPSVLRAEVVAQRAIGSSGYTASVLEVALRDKHEQWVELKEGSVSVDGLLMSYDGFGAYVRNDPVQPDVDYTFVVTLSDGSKYTSKVHTPKNLSQFTVPATYNRTGPFTVSWREVDPTASATLDLVGDSASAEFSVSSSQGSYTLQATDLARFHAGETVRVMLTFTKSGQVDGRFMSTSFAEALFSITRNTQIR